MAPRPAWRRTAAPASISRTATFGTDSSRLYQAGVLLFLFFVAVMDEHRLQKACKNGDHAVVLDICQKHPCAVTHTFRTVQAGLHGSYGHDVTCLHLAAVRGHVECCRVLLDCGANVEAKDNLGRTALMYAKTCEVVQLLLSRGANVKARDEQRRTALHHCVIVSQDIRCVGELASAGASVTAEDNGMWTPLMVLISRYVIGDARSLDVGLDLVKRGADVNTTDKHGTTLLHLCAGKSHDCVGFKAEGQCLHITRLVRLGANLDARTKEGKTALHIAAEGNQEEIVFQLIKLGADVNIIMSNEDGETVLHHAAKAGYSHHRYVQELLKAGADTEARDKHGHTPLLCAAWKGHSQTVCALADAGAALDVCNKNGETAIHFAAKNGHTQTVCALADAGAALNVCNKNGETAIHFAALNGHTKTVCALAASIGTTLNVCNKRGETAVHLAAKNGHTRALCALAHAGAAVDVCNRHGETAVHLAAKNGHTRTVALLIAYGAPFDSFDQVGFTPLFHAIHGGFTEIVRKLTKAGSSQKARDKDDNTSLHLAAKANHHELVKPLVEAGASVQALNRKGESALLLSAKLTSTLVASNLLKFGASIDEHDYDGNTPFSVALKRGNGELCCELVRYGAKVDDTISFFPCLSNAVKERDVGLLSRLVSLGSSINECDENGSSALHVALTFGHVEIAEWIIEHGGDVSLADASGLTPLHLTANSYIISVGNRLQLAKLLLAKGANPTALTNRAETARDLAKQQSTYFNPFLLLFLEKVELAHELIQEGGVVGSPDAIAIRFGGPPGAGKSTLTDALQVSRVRGFFRYESQTDEGATNMHQRTKGINCHTFVDENTSRFTIFDLGGHGEFLATHQMFIGDGSVPVIDCVLVSALDEKLKDNALKWCSLFASRNQPVTTPWPLLLMASRADKATQQQKNAVISVYRDIKQTFSEHFRFPCSEPLFIDARKSWNELTVELRQVLNQLHRELVNHGDSQRKPAICQSIEENLPALRKTTPSPVMLKERFIKFMLPRIRLRSQPEAEITAGIVSLFDKALKYLSGYATVLFFSQSMVERYVVINPQWLLSDIVGRLMAEQPLPGPHVHYDNGYAKTSDVVAALETEHLPGREALEMVAGLGFCLEQKSADTVLNPSKLRTHRLDKHWLQTEVMVVNAGRRLKCKGTVVIASAFFSHLQVHFYHRYLSDYDETLPMWTGGIRVAAGRTFFGGSHHRVRPVQPLH